jgi:hypothetical protein
MVESLSELQEGKKNYILTSDKINVKDMKIS